MTVGILTYNRERVFWRLRVRRDRLAGNSFDLKDPAAVSKTLTRWLARWCERRGHISGTATVKVDTESMLLYNEPVIVGMANAFMSPAEHDIEVLRSVIDKPDAHAVQVFADAR